MATLLEIYGLQCGEGWQSLYMPLVKRCRVEGIEIREIKEKWGRLHFYLAPGGSDELNDAILTAEAASAEICEICGEAGQLATRNGFVLTRCLPHRDTPATVGRGLDA